MTNTRAAIVTAALLLLTSIQAHAEAESPWLIRLRALAIDPEHGSDAIPALGVPSDAIRVERKWTPELDISYFFTRNLSAELVLAYTTLNAKVTSSAVGAFKAGDLKALPPTLTVQWHFMPESTLRPYVGAGANYTRISKVNLSVPALALPLDVERSSFGAALQAGIDVSVGGNWLINVDVKKVWLDLDLKAGGQKVSQLSLDPWLFGIGIGRRF
jgi:outer membrane protein